MGEIGAMQGDLARQDSERATVLVAYGLLLLALFNGITALIGVVIAYVRRDDARGTVWESHYRNMISVFWVGAVCLFVLMTLALTGMLAALGLAIGTAWLDEGGLLALPLLGAAVPLTLMAFTAFGVWYLYRTLRGLIRALDGKGY